MSATAALCAADPGHAFDVALARSEAWDSADMLAALPSGSPSWHYYWAARGSRSAAPVDIAPLAGPSTTAVIFCNIAQRFLIFCLAHPSSKQTLEPHRLSHHCFRIPIPDGVCRVASPPLGQDPAILASGSSTPCAMPPACAIGPDS